MAGLSIAALKAKRFGKRRTTPTSELQCSRRSALQANPLVSSASNSNHGDKLIKKEVFAKKSRRISQSLRYKVWQRDKGQCVLCGSKRNLNYDHIKPVALGGGSVLNNLRVLCFNCNQRQAIKMFGIRQLDFYS